MASTIKDITTDKDHFLTTHAEKITLTLNLQSTCNEVSGLDLNQGTELGQEKKITSQVGGGGPDFSGVKMQHNTSAYSRQSKYGTHCCARPLETR